MKKTFALLVVGAMVMSGFLAACKPGGDTQSAKPPAAKAPAMPSLDVSAPPLAANQTAPLTGFIKSLGRASARGHPEAQFNLGVMYARGQGVRQDYVRAYAWFVLADAGGEKRAGKAKKVLTERMSPQQIAKSTAMAKEMSDKIKSDKIKSDRIKSDRIKSDKIKSDKIK